MITQFKNCSPNCIRHLNRRRTVNELREAVEKLRELTSNNFFKFLEKVLHLRCVLDILEAGEKFQPLGKIFYLLPQCFQLLPRRRSLCRPQRVVGKTMVVRRHRFKVGPIANRADVTILTIVIDSLEEFQQPEKWKNITDVLVMFLHFPEGSGRNVGSVGLENRRSDTFDLCFKQTRKTTEVEYPHRKEFAIEVFQRIFFVKKVEELFEHFPQAR